MALLPPESKIENSFQVDKGYVAFQDVKAHLISHGFMDMTNLSDGEWYLAEKLSDINLSEERAVLKDRFLVDEFRLKGLCINGICVSKQIDRVLSGRNKEPRPILSTNITDDESAIDVYAKSVVHAVDAFMLSRPITSRLITRQVKDLYWRHNRQENMQMKDFISGYWAYGILLGFVAMDRYEADTN